MNNSVSPVVKGLITFSSPCEKNDGESEMQPSVKLRVINPLETGTTPLFVSRLEPAEDVTKRIVVRKHFLKKVQKCFFINGRTRD